MKDIDIKIDSIQDLKDLVSGKHESQTKIKVGGYVPEKEPEIKRETGEKWFDKDGFEWEQKEGYAVKLGKDWQQELHATLNSFPNCPKETCECTFPKRLDNKMRVLRGMCFDCVVKEEHKMRIENKWEDYERQKMKENALAWLTEAERDKQLVVEELSRLDFVNSFGDVEKWHTGVSREELIEKIEKEFKEFRENFINKLENPDVGEVE